METPSKPARDDLDPPNWAAIESHYRAGLLSVRSIGVRYGVSHTAINKRAANAIPPWTRNATPQVNARANQLVHERSVQAAADLVASSEDSNHKLVANTGESGSTGAISLPPQKTPTSARAAELQDAAIIEASAEAVAIVIVKQRKSIERLRSVGEKLLAELEDSLDRPELAGMVFDALTDPDLTNQKAMLADLARFITSLPERSRVYRTLTETFGMVISLERTSFGLNTADDESGVPTAIVKDYTGVGDPDSPGFDTDRIEEA